LDSANYTVFGLSLRSNVSIPSLKHVAAPSATPDIEVRFNDVPRLDSAATTDSRSLIFASSVKTELGEPAFRIWRVSRGSLIHLEYQDGMNFWMDRGGNSVWARWPDSLTLEDAAAYLFGPVLGLLLRLRGMTCLHASAVAFENRAVAFVGSEGAGKSTTAAAFAQRGHAVLSDDVVALVERDGAFYVMPAYPYLSLWPDSVESLYGPEKALPSFSRNFDKRRLALGAKELKFEEKALPLGAIFLLGDRTSDEAAPYLESPTPQEALVALVANSYAGHLVDVATRASEFALLGRVVSTVPIRRLQPHTDPARIQRLCDLVSDLVSDAPGSTQTDRARPARSKSV
jgi:hypothetical protein